jgi:hypothetical protein
VRKVTAALMIGAMPAIRHLTVELSGAHADV